MNSKWAINLFENMEKEQIFIIKKTWRLLKNIDPIIIGDVFYSKLFLESPSLKRMFKGNMEDQSKKLIEMLSYIVMNINDLNNLTKSLISLADRHIGYGVKPEHYKKVGEALIWTLEKGLGNDWNIEVETAWLSCYTLVAESMMKVEQA